MQNAQRVRRRYGVARPHHQVQPCGQREVLNAPTGARPLDEAAVLGVLALEVIGRLPQLYVVDPGDVGAIAQRLAQQPKERELALQAAHLVGVEAELEHVTDARLDLAGEPDLAEPSLAELPHEPPVVPAGYRQPDRRAPPVHLLLARRDGASGLLAVGRRGEGRHAVDPDLKDVHRLVGALEVIGPVRHPAYLQRLTLGVLAAVLLDVLPPVVEDRTGHQDLPRKRQPHQPRADVGGQAHELGAVAAGLLQLGHLTQVQAHPDPHRLRLPTLRCHRLLEAQAGADAVGNRLEARQEPVTRVLEDLRSPDRPDDLLEQRVVARDDLRIGGGPEAGLEVHGLHEVREQEHHQPRGDRGFAHRRSCPAFIDPRARRSRGSPPPRAPPVHTVPA